MIVQNVWMYVPSEHSTVQFPVNTEEKILQRMMLYKAHVLTAPISMH
ncbi:hypothetical protein [Enterococcus faecium]|nr:hypothetical protein [Enterococcus faecium]